jgi:hypothetical protein
MTFALTRGYFNKTPIPLIPVIKSTNSSFQPAASCSQFRSISSRIFSQKMPNFESSFRGGTNTWNVTSDTSFCCSGFKTSLLRARTFSSLFTFLNRRDCNGDTPLHLGVKSSSGCEICEHLLQKGADPNIPDKHGKTPLDTAMANNDIDMVNLLLKYGAITSASLRRLR